MAVARPLLLILRPLGIGDLLTAVPALRALARAFPEHERVLAAPGSLRPLVGLIDGENGALALDRVVSVGELEALPEELHGADVAVNLHGRGPQSHRVLMRARPRRTLWFENAAVPRSRGSPRWLPGEHEVQRWCRMLAESGIACRPARLGLRAPPGRPPEGAEGATILHPGASSPARRWPPHRFAQVARAEVRHGHGVVITGATDDLPVAEDIARRAGLPETSVIAGRTDLAELARVIAHSGRVVCGDTGVGHMATALGTSSVVLFGPTSPAEWGPPAGHPQHRALWTGRRGDPHAAKPDQGLLEIEAPEVIRALRELPPRGRHASVA